MPRRILVFWTVIVCLSVGAEIQLAQRATAPSAAPRPATAAAVRGPAGANPVAAQSAIVQQYCVGCHSDAAKTGGLTLAHFDLAHLDQNAETAEKMIRKLRVGFMPPPGAPRPDAAALKGLVSFMETAIDGTAAVRPNPGNRVLQRLNRAQYANTIRQLLDLDVDITGLLPPDSMGRGFDNIGDALTLSPTLMEAYLRAAGKISRLAVGDPQLAAAVATYSIPRTASQMRHTEGAPLGTRGGISVIHNFPADGQYVFRMDLYDSNNGDLFGTKAENEQIELSINGARAALLDIDPKMSVTNHGIIYVQTPSVSVQAGPQRISAAFIEKASGPIDDLVAPIEQTMADTEQTVAYGITLLPHLKNLAISGPFGVKGISETPSRRKVFTCRPRTSAQETVCATEIIKRLSTQAYRRSASPEDLEGLMNFYRLGREDGNFEAGVRTALEAMLASPNFVFRIEREPPAAKPGKSFQISDVALASRLSYFLWSTAPDDDLLALASRNKLHEPVVLEAQVKRMLADPRSETLSSRFAVQWLHLSDLGEMRPDPLTFPQFDTTLAQSMQRETELFFDSIVREDHNVLDLLTADYTFVDERLAKHYGVPNIMGSRFRRVPVTDGNRRGLLGEGSILTLTSIADRTSPVARGKFVMEVLLGTPPPPPPPNVPELAETKAAQGDKLLTLRERMEEHRKNATCAGCHKMMDPIGLALENFDATGRWRKFDNGSLIDPNGQLFDGTKVDGPASLRNALLNHSGAFLQNFTEQLMMYGLGRRVEYYDMPTVRTITRKAGQHNNRFSSFVLGIVQSPAFQMRIAQETTNQQN